MIEQKENILSDHSFIGFFDQATKLIERCLNQERDPLRDYTGSNDDHLARVGDDNLVETLTFLDEKYTKDRPVTDIRFSPKFPELLLASYGQMEEPTLTDPDGVVLVWSLGLESRPESTFTSNSPVLTAIFDRFNPALYVGGTYSGSILLWDARAKKSAVQRTPLTSKGHAHPVFAMEQVGTQNATNLVTTSTDGRLCIWSLSMLSTPHEFVELKKSGRDVATTCCSFPDEETNMLYIGAECGSVCQVHIHGTKQSPITDNLEGHDGPITAVDFHPQPEGSGSLYSSLLLSSSMDWSVKLWNVKKSTFPLLHFDGMYEDYVTDVKWHPIAPYAFSSVDAEGIVNLWNLNRDMEAPILRKDPQKCALNRCDWSKDGRYLATGDVEGNIQILSADPEYSTPKPDDFTRFEERIESLEPLVSDSKYLYGRTR